MGFSFDNAIPASGDNPSADQPGMLNNNISTALIIDVDHIGFNQTPGGGKHRWTRLITPASLGASLPGGVLNEGLVYTKTASSAGVLTETDLFYRPDATSDEYQLTRTITASLPTFGTDTNYIGGNTGGWTFLPGGLLLQYGFTTPAVTPGDTPIVYPVKFVSGPAFSITVSPVVSTGANFVAGVKLATSTSTGFSATTASTGSVKSYYWIAIGV